MKTPHQLLAILTFGSLLLYSCTKSLEIAAAKNQVEQGDVFNTTALATSAVLGAYSTLSTVHTRIKYISLYADEYGYTSITDDIIQFRDSKVIPDALENIELWRDLFSVIYQANAVLEGIAQSPAIPAGDKATLGAEAKFLRAYSYFYLINLYGSIPLVLSTDVNENRTARQRPKSDVYAQISKDLLEAKSALPPEYNGTGKVRANKWAASALLARTYLYQQKWLEAERESSAIINSGLYTPLNKPEEVFLADSREAIFQLWVVNGFLSDAPMWIPPSVSVLPTYPLTDALYGAFDNADGRKVRWISSSKVVNLGIEKTYHYLLKYKNSMENMAAPEYIMTLRSAEQYLICAESQIHLGKNAEAIAHLNVIRERATGLMPLSSSLGREKCLEAMMKERQTELFGEWCHRFFDLKRTAKIDQVMESSKPTWTSYAKLLPIPKSEITFNPNLTQNEGY